MSRAIFLDAGVLSVVANPGITAEVIECNRWVQRHAQSGTQVFIPEITDYEVRRELIRAGKLRSLIRLDALKQRLPYAPLTTEIMLRAAQLWATARQEGYPTADAKALDADVILAATAMAYQNVNSKVIIATTNVRHLSRFVAAALWRQI